MRTKLYAIAPAIAVTMAVMALGGCRQNMGKTAETAGEITDFEIKQTVKSLERDYACDGAESVYGDSVKVYSTVRMAIEWPDVMGGYDLKTLQDSLLLAAFDTTGISINDAMTSAAGRPEGRDLFKMRRVDSIPDSIPAMIYSRDVIISAITFSKKFVVYQIMTATYNGGAHGMTESTFVNYDFAKGNVITCDNAFRPGSEATLLQAVKDNLMTQYNVSSMKELDGRGIFTDQIYVTKNIYLQGYDVVFHYNPYDIAPYSEGSIDVRVPYFQIPDCLTPEVSALLTDNDF